MKIGFVAEPYEETNASGMGYVVIELMRQLLARHAEHAFTIYSSKQVNKSAVPGEYKVIHTPKSMFGRLRYFMTMREDIDALIFTVPLSPLLAPRRIRTVLLCQEIIPLAFPRRLNKESVLVFLRDYILMPLSLKRAAKVIVPSLATKELLMQVYHTPEEKISLVYNGFQDLSHFASQAEPVDVRMKPFFLFTGKIKHRKNVHGIVEAFIEFKKRTPNDTKLVLAGDYEGGYYESLQKELQENNLSDQVFFLGYVTGAPLYSLYKEALALVFPSFSEGFGMPIVESFAAGTPVITATIPATAEVAGDAGILVDPHNPHEISEAMEKIYADGALRADIIKKGYDRAGEFSWEKAADKVMNIFTALR